MIGEAMNSRFLDEVRYRYCSSREDHFERSCVRSGHANAASRFSNDHEGS